MPRALILALALFLFGAPAAAAQQQPPVAIVDADKPLAVAADPVAVRLLNNTDTDLAVAVSARAVAADGATVAVVVDGAPARIARGEDAWVKVKVTDPPDEEISGYLVVVANGVVVRRPLTVSATATAVPAVDSWDTEWAAFWSHSAPYELPGRVPVDGACPAGASGTVVSGHDTATVTAACTDKGLALTMSEPSSSGPSFGVGEYKGTLKFGDEEVAVTVGRSSPMWVALVFLLAGVGAALVGSTYTVDRRPHNQRRTAIDAVAPPEGPLGEPVRVAKERLWADLEATRPSFWRRLAPWPTGAYAAELDKIDKDAACLKDISLRAKSYEEAAAVLTANRQLLAERMPSMAFDRLATPPKATVDQLADHVADVLAVPALVEVARRMDELEAALGRAVDGEEKQKAEARFRGLTAAVGRLGRPTEIESVRNDLDEVTKLVDQLERTRALGVESLAVGGIAIPWDAVQKFLSGTGTTALAARDAGVAVLIGLVALWSGFAALYVAGDTWGTLWDVLAAVTWGAGATAVSGPLLTAVRRVGSTQQKGE